MNNSLPLLEKKVLIPRGEKQAKSFSQLVEKYGGIPVEIPLLAFRPITLNDELDAMLQKVDTYDWIIFTSNVTVETFFSHFNMAADTGFPKIAVIGKKTAETLASYGLKPSFMPAEYVAESFAEEFAPLVGAGTKVLIPKGNLAREYIATRLGEAGAQVDEIVIYETYMPPESRSKLASMMKTGELDILMFTSPSTVDHLMDVVSAYHLEEQLKKCIISCIGPVSEKRVRAYGLPVHASPKEYTVEEMIKSTIAFLENHLEV